MLSQLILVSVCWVSAARVAFADSSISYDDHSGIPNAGTYLPGDSFSFDITIAGTDIGPGNSVGVFSLWFASAAQNDGLLRITANIFPALSPFSEHAETLAPGGEAITSNGNMSNLGGSQPTPPNWLGPPGVPANSSYFVATITRQVAGTASPGEYSIFDLLTNAPFHTSALFSGLACPSCPFYGPYEFSETPYFITIVPEPAVWALVVVGALLGSLLTASRNRLGP